MDGEAWWATVHWVAKSRTGLSNFTFTFHFHALEKEMATHSSVLAWRIPGTGEPSGLPSMGSHRVGHDWSNLAAAAAEYRWGWTSFCLFIAYSDFFCVITCDDFSVFIFFICGSSLYILHRNPLSDGCRIDSICLCLNSDLSLTQ